MLDHLGLVATLEASADQLDHGSGLSRRLPGLRIVLDHVGWLADESQVSTRIDAIGTIFGAWDVDMIRPWLVGVVEGSVRRGAETAQQIDGR